MSDKTTLTYDELVMIAAAAEKVTRERDALRAENERLTKAWADSEAACLIQVQMVRAENERLRDVAWKHGNRADEAEVEIERLRAAIESQARATAYYNGQPDGDRPDPTPGVNEPIWKRYLTPRAREALACAK